ncbi:MAG: CocE/NonD family hydrolase [Streptosporangiaceae bacterium]
MQAKSLEAVTQEKPHRLRAKVGLAGVSYLAISQYRAVALRPPHLAAICPWEGFSDIYRDLARPGGVREGRVQHHVVGDDQADRPGLGKPAEGVRGAPRAAIVVNCRTR